jgi:hypothetical protein
MPVSEQLKAVEQRWQAFAAKVGARIEEIFSEADAGFDEIIATEVLDPAPLSGALSELTARLQGISKKVDEAFEKIDPDLDRAMEAAGGAEVQAVSKARDELVRRRAALCESIAVRGEEMGIRKSADAARRLREIAAREMEKEGGGKKCSGCGAPLKPEVLHEPSNVTCGHCKAVNSIHPGMGTALYYGGGALHALACEAALAKAPDLRAAEKRWHWLRHKTDDDLRRHEEGALAYWRVYCEAFARLQPGGSTANVEAAARAKLGWLREEARRDEYERKAVSAALKLAAAGDRAGIARWLEESDVNVSLDELIVAAHEHGDRKGAEVLLEVAHEQAGSDEPLARFKVEKLKELDADLARR